MADNPYSAPGSDNSETPRKRRRRQRRRIYIALAAAVVLPLLALLALPPSLGIKIFWALITAYSGAFMVGMVIMQLRMDSARSKKRSRTKPSDSPPSPDE